MPHSSSTEEKPKKRAPRKRVAKKTPTKRVTRKRVVKKASKVSEVEMSVVDGSSNRISRKAPTLLAKERAENRTKQKQIAIAGGVLVVGVVGSVLIGLTDKGQINISEVIQARNERLQNGEFDENDTRRVAIPVQDSAQLPNGGLTGRGRGTAPIVTTPEPATGTSTATSTDATASSSTESATSSEVIVLDEEISADSEGGDEVDATP